ncbi:hypothetical protein VspSTUT11_29030 [Vibrio sp. STUT-A11]|nr:hypothetical protein VspSTUT11_29030 [Vibrio sp. STUT-A11]
MNMARFQDTKNSKKTVKKVLFFLSITGLELCSATLLSAAEKDKKDNNNEDLRGFRVDVYGLGNGSERDG